MEKMHVVESKKRVLALNWFWGCKARNLFIGRNILGSLLAMASFSETKDDKFKKFRRSFNLSIFGLENGNF